MRKIMTATAALLAGCLVIAAGVRADDAPASGKTAPSETKKPSPPKIETAVFAGGCFWCTELVFEQLKGVVNVESGYCGGTAATANYDRVHLGNTRHAESVRVTYDPQQISYGQLLDVFFDAHDPTQRNRQGPDDVGPQYRSAIFFADEAQKAAAEAKIKELDQKKAYRRRIATKLEPLTAFFPAEFEHQDFARRFPGLPYIQSHAIPKASAVRTLHPELIDPRR